jgi:hypothetical protein
MQRIFALFLLVLLMACASQRQPQQQAPEVAWQQAGSISYESQFPGMGSSRRFTSDAGWIDVYTYGLGRNNWQSGLMDPQFDASFESTIKEVRVAQERGVYTDLQVGTPQNTSIAGQPFRTVSFRFTLNKKPMHSVTYMSARNGQLLKYRVSIFATSGLDVDALARRFIEENLRTDPGAAKTRQST